MAREIKFRGKRLDNGEWAYGSLLQEQINGATCECIIIDHIYARERKQIKVGTCGQYTGLQDRNGKEIFEGDIVNVSFGDNVVPLWVLFDCGSWCIREKCDETPHYLASYTSNDNNVVVIGNIHDNPDLLEGGEE